MKRAILQSCDENHDRYLDLTEDVHREYAWNCDADYLLIRGSHTDAPHPSWNRIPLMLDAFASGYDKVVWLDADTLVVKPDRNIFTETDDDVPFQMTRVKDSHKLYPWLTPGWDLYNSGVIVANNTASTVTALDHVWSLRHAEALPHHDPRLWELNWINDLVHDDPALVAPLSFIWNWQPFSDAGPRSEACILAWHGWDDIERYAAMCTEYGQVYGQARPDDDALEWRDLMDKLDE